MVGGKCDIGSSAVPDLFDQVPVVVVGYNLDVDLFGIISRYKGVDFSVKAVAQGAVFAYGKKRTGFWVWKVSWRASFFPGVRWNTLKLPFSSLR